MTEDLLAEIQCVLNKVRLRVNIVHCAACGSVVNCWDREHTRCHQCGNNPDPSVVTHAFREAEGKATKEEKDLT